MNGKRFVGENASSFETYKPKTPVTGVRLVVDDENEYVAGDMSGNVWEMTCPYATQEMANNILDGLKGQVYKGFEADDAVLDPSAELGDGITVNGLYSVLAYRKVQFGPGHMSTIAAPGDNEPDEEYKYTPKRDRETERKFAQTRSLIEKSAEEIRLAIEATDGRVSELKVTLDGVTITDESGTTRIKGSSIETGSIAVGSIRADQINLTGAISWSDLTDDCKQTIDGMIPPQVTLPKYIKSTYIDNAEIRSPTIMANVFEVHPSDSSTSRGSYDIYGAYGGYEYHMFSITYSSSGTPSVQLWSPEGARMIIGSSAKGLVDATGNWDFSTATVTGLHMTFTA